MNENQILQLREEFEDKICRVLNENDMCNTDNNCINCINTVLKILLSK